MSQIKEIKKLLALDDDGKILKEYYESEDIGAWWIAKECIDGKFGLITHVGEEYTKFIYDDYRFLDFSSMIDAFGTRNFNYIIDSWLIRIDENDLHHYTLCTSDSIVTQEEFLDVNVIVSDETSMNDEFASCAIVKNNDEKYGIIHGSGKMIHPCEYINIQYDRMKITLTHENGDVIHIGFAELYTSLINLN